MATITLRPVCGNRAVAGRHGKAIRGHGAGDGNWRAAGICTGDHGGARDAGGHDRQRRGHGDHAGAGRISAVAGDLERRIHGPAPGLVRGCGRWQVLVFGAVTAGLLARPLRVLSLGRKARAGLG